MGKKEVWENGSGECHEKKKRGGGGRKRRRHSVNIISFKMSVSPGFYPESLKRCGRG